jgi:hypothetical protein
MIFGVLMSVALPTPTSVVNERLTYLNNPGKALATVERVLLTLMIFDAVPVAVALRAFPAVVLLRVPVATDTTDRIVLG